ncbi:MULTISPECIES: GmrSD restriction endonuclease domain-containing protein [Klebsiella]|uniref:GmrSD restriction endonuclease domain-containing protein n=1 Tax=Klebsiella TaxID=570 RepID=UPI0013EF15A5|nr:MULTISPECIES: DUF262 domain-containing protein [Klebsiella]MDS0159619.1 DUF262 domain-containing protein [Klebsiella pneumoniae]HBT6081968.1 DUF262 domain-containing protein [Klebsiella quasipneumoniae]HBT6127551.1 DUF262 domain-containing protein [Klebsiella quasipneumoniae]HBT6223494.1 DUF262 domain-containing protein [Klebsiella quasipneumoniae]HBT6245323.1 DUF262 domain-containing protein [Klebsiella quasipneumoniae]
MSSAVTPQLVQRVFELYLENKLVVNRRYQRKLVWTIEEKEKFIDSLASGYPIPLILTSKQEGSGADVGVLEILDGLQRLNAITSFIECDFSLNGKYFDLETTSLTKKQKDSGELLQKTPILDNKTCSAILNYQIPFLTTHLNTPAFIDETFRRINTGGRRLSMQDVRQAGSLGIVPETINRISNYVRKDSSRTDVVTLRNMKNISIGDDRLNYGININDIFWVKSDIIRKEDIRESRDEELITHLLSYVSVPRECHTTSDYLNKVYDASTREHQNLASTLEKYKEDFIIKSFNYIFDELNKVFKDDRGNFSETIYSDRKQKSSRCFQVIFLSMYELIINDGMAVSNYKDLHTSLKGIYDKHYKSIMGNGRKWHNDERTALIEATKGIISKHFIKSKDNTFEPGNWIRNIENIINESKTEQQSYDFKMGLMTLSNTKREFNFSLVDKILKTLTAMTNSISGECTVIVGVAESESDAKDHEMKFKRSYIKYNNKFIVGIDSEADFLHGGIEQYLKQLKDYIGKTKLISDDFKKRVLNRLSNFTYKEKEILIFRAERGISPEAYDNKYYERHLSHNAEVTPGAAMNDLFRRF